MLSWLKRHFIPHEENNHRPHFLHGENARALVAIVLVFELILFVLPTFNFTGIARNSNLGTVLPAVLATLTNQERASRNLPTLQVSSLLTQAATLKAEDMAAKSYFSHNSPDGKTPWYWFDLVGYKYSYAGENLAVNFSDSIDVTEAWMNSPGHMANIVKANYQEMGTGIAFGTYKGHQTIFVVQMYANPREEERGVLAKVIPPVEAATVSENLEEEKIAVAVEEKTETADAKADSPEDHAVLGASQVENSPGEPSALEMTLASPRHLVNAILIVVGGLVLISIFLIVLIRFNRHHPDLVTNGLIVLAFIFGIYLVNAYISRQSGFSTSYTSIELQEK